MWHSPSDVEEALDRSLAALQLDYGRDSFLFLSDSLNCMWLTAHIYILVDLYLMHCTVEQAQLGYQ